MKLVEYQLKYYNLLYKAIVEENQNLIIFTGDKGCGKSTILQELTSDLKENWKVFVITGTGKNSPPYYTWYASSTKHYFKPQKKLTGISFGVNFQPIGLPFSAQLDINTECENLIFNSNDQAILKAIGFETQHYDNVLFIADDYNSWDSASKELLLKIFILNENMDDYGKNTYMILVDSFLDDLGLEKFKKCNIAVENILVEDIAEIIYDHTLRDALTLSKIKRILPITGYDLCLIKLAMLYQQEGDSTANFNSLIELLDKRLESLTEEQRETLTTLQSVSIIQSMFSEKEAAYLTGMQIAYTEKILQRAVELKFIEKPYNYNFLNEQIQNYFIEKLESEKKYFHYKFTQYLQENHPEDYLNRALHLFLSEKVENEANIIDAIYYLIIEIIRRKEITCGKTEQKLEEKLQEMLNYVPHQWKKQINSNIKFFYKALNAIRQCDYCKSIMFFSEIQFSYTSKAFTVEAKCFQLLAYVQLADDLTEIKKLANELYRYIYDNEFKEDELWCRAALLLLEVYGDRHVDTECFNNLKKDFQQKLQKHIYHSTVFETLDAKYACKSILFENPMIAIKRTESSCIYYRKNNSILNLYFSLCNNAANRIVCGDYEVASERLRETKELMSQSPKVIYPSTYKIENNIIINEFLISEGKPFDYQARNENHILSLALDASKTLERLQKNQGYEVSHVIGFNLLSMYMLLDNQEKSSVLLEQFEMEYKYLDPFYKYYFHSAACSNCLLEQDYKDALTHLDKLESMHVTLLINAEKVLSKRCQILRQLIMEQYTGSAYEFNYEFLKRKIKVQDMSATFWGRGFLLSDLQFLSL